jgi:prepilin-type N-terminal cleavage/methylation domain-containing protein
MRIRLKCSRCSAEDSSPAGANLPDHGYTLAEVMVAVGILGFVATTLYGAFSAGFCVIQSARENLRATQIMVQKVEAIRLFTWSQICDTNNYLKGTFVEPYDPLGVANNCGGAQYTGYVSASIPAATELPDAYRANMRTITVSLYWTNYNGGKAIVHAREMQTRVARNGMQNYIWGAL